MARCVVRPRGGGEGNRGWRGVALSAALLSALAFPLPALAQAVGGNGGTSTAGFGGGGGPGGTGTSPNGGNGVSNVGGGGGGGGGGVSTTTGLGGSGGSGGGSSNFNSAGGNGGGGGAYFLVNPGTITTGTGTGGSGGGSAGNAQDDGGGGGGGGAGGGGVLFTGTGISVSNGVSISGGAGGNGGKGGSGTSFYGGNGGNGGGGGDGIDFTGTATFTNTGTITGGNGGTGNTGGTGPDRNGSNGAAGAGGVGVLGAGLAMTNSGTISGGLANAGAGARADALVFTGGVNSLDDTGGTLNGNIAVSGSLNFTQTGAVSLSNIITDGPNGAGSVINSGAGTLTLTSTNSYSGGTSITGGLINFNNAGNFGSGAITLNGGGLQWAIGNTTDISNTLNAIGANGATFDTNGNAVTLATALTGAGGVTVANSGVGGALTFTASEGYTGATTINPGATLALSGAGSIAASSGVTDNGTFNIAPLAGGTTITSLAGSGTVTLGANTLTLSNASDTFSGGISGGGGLTLSSGKEVLSGTNSYLGATTINGGTLEVDGALTGTSGVTVNAGGTLTGTGTVDPLTVSFASGSTFTPGTAGTPGTFMTIVGNLVLNPGATYAVSLNPTTSSFASVQGTATLTGATANASFASGSYVSKKYTILTATSGLGGTTFAGLTNTNLPAGASDSLSYDANDAYLNLTAGFSNLTGLNTNQQNVANALTNAFSGGGVPAAFLGLSANGLTQVDGEAATGAQFGAFKLMDQFLALMLDPFVDGRSGAGWPSGGGSANGFAPDQQASFPPDIALAYAGVLKAAPKQTFDQRWSAWGSSFGGYDKTNGNPTVGSNTVTARDYGFAGGMDYHFSPDTVAGFALAGGGTNWGLAQGLGGGRSDAFQAGVYGTTRAGPAYIAAALAFTNHWMTTNRIAFAGDQLDARFNAQSYGGRIETGYRYAALPTIGITPYAALQAQSFHTPRYNETDLTGGGFGLSYNAMTATDTRSELGSRFDDMTMINGMPLSLRARAAWAHDWVTNPSADAVFQALPSASFIVNGATPPKNSALASAGAELHVTANWSLAAKFDGEFAAGSQTYAGTGTLRYSW